MKMTMNEYHKQAMRTSPRDGHDKLDNGMLGLIGETGELADLYKKYIYQSRAGAEIPAERFADELGDVLWYLAEIADGMEKNLADVVGADFDCLEESAKKGNKRRSLRSNIIDMCETAMLIEKTTDFDRVWIYMHLMLEHAAMLALKLDLPLTEIAARNIEKLKKRYPDGFDAERSEARYE